MNNDIEIAIDILAIMLSKSIFDKEELKNIYRERKLVYEGDKETIEKVINVYGKRIKEEVDNERD